MPIIYNEKSKYEQDEEGFGVHDTEASPPKKQNEEKKSKAFALNLVPKEDVPDEFMETAGNLFQTIKDETKDKVGEGLADAAFNAAFSNKTASTIKNGKPRNTFAFIIPRKLHLNTLITTPKAYRDFAHEIYTKQGFKQGKVGLTKYMGTQYYKYSKDKKLLFSSFYSAPTSIIPVAYQLQMVLYCCYNNEANRSIVIEGHIPKGYNPMAIFENTDILNVYAENTIDYSPTAITGEFYPSMPKVKRALNEHLDLSDTNTRQAILAMNEADHNKVLTALTSKLYDHIVKKTADIDFGEIPKTKGDITKLKNYDDIAECISIMKDILKEYRQDPAPIDTLSVALVNLQTRKELFEKGFRYDCELPCMMYNTVALSIINGISYMIAACIEFIKAPRDDSFSIALDKVAYAKTKDHMLYNSLEKFNKSCQNGDFDRAMGVVIDRKLRKFSGAIIGALAGTVVGILIVMNIVPILRELVYCIYYSRVRMADFFEMQADLLQMNAYNLEHNNTMDPEKKREIVEDQKEIALVFRNIANKVMIDAKKSDVEANKELQQTKTKFSLDELDEEEPAAESDSVLF